MKNNFTSIFFLICIFITGQTFTLGAEINTKTPVKFIYINGSNNNTEKRKSEFIAGMKKMHISMKRDFEDNNFIKKNMLNNGNMYIMVNPKIFFWGYNSSEALNDFNNDIFSLNMISPTVAQTVRTIIAKVMHDAIWVQKEYNMQVIVNNLHKDVMNAYKNGEKVVLFGHSAGSFVTYRYLFHKLPAISTKELTATIERNENGTIDKFFSQHSVKSTCIDALTSSKVGFGLATGGIAFNPNKEELKKNYLKLDEFTSTQCVPNNEVLGVVNYGSPLALFYSDANTTALEINRYNIDLYRYLNDNNMFFLTVNFKDDPIGFPIGKNLTAEEMENIYNIGFNTTGRGFMYSKSNVSSPSTFIGAHESYWKFPNKFAKDVVSAYVEGYKNFYSDL